MSSHTNVKPSYFRWIIHPPFVPGQTMKAKFFLDTPTVTEWRVEVKFVERGIGCWDLLLSLIFDTLHDERKRMEASGLIIRISLDGNYILNRNYPRYIFYVENRFTYYDETRNLMLNQTEPHQIIVDTAISLAEDSLQELNFRRRQERDPQEVSFQNDLRYLAKDLCKLVHIPLCYNVDLYSSDNKVFRAHSYILSERWNKLFRIDTTANTVVKTNISSHLLWDILVYMYSALLSKSFPDWTNPSYASELFQVIDRYKIYHLYKALIKCDTYQLRVSKKSELNKFYEFRLHFVNDGLVKDASLSWHSQEFSTTLGVRYQQNEFILQIRVKNRNKAGAWLSYSLKSKAQSRVYAQVNLEILKMAVMGSHTRKFVQSIPAHAFNYKIGPNETVESGPVLFLGCLETFGDFPSTMLSGKIQQWFRFSICFTDGTLLEQYQSFNKGVERYLARLDVLSNHMFELRSKETHSDMRLESYYLWDEYGRFSIFPVHKAIIATRIPQLHAVLIGPQPEHALPDFATVGLGDNALFHVLDYIYSGKLINVSDHVLGEISDFAILGNLPTLTNLISVLRSNRGIRA